MLKKWGSYKVIKKGNGYKVKILTVKPHSATSIQRHRHRAEFWICLQGSLLTGVRYIWVNQWHQLRNDTDWPLTVIEVQIGRICKENDIERKKSK
jgi:mannose-6-phosphate isomerase-like protein (cupin superfamily)